MNLEELKQLVRDTIGSSRSEENQRILSQLADATSVEYVRNILISNGWSETQAYNLGEIEGAVEDIREIALLRLGDESNDGTYRMTPEWRAEYNSRLANATTVEEISQAMEDMAAETEYYVSVYGSGTQPGYGGESDAARKAAKEEEQRARVSDEVEEVVDMVLQNPTLSNLYSREALASALLADSKGEAISIVMDVIFQTEGGAPAAAWDAMENIFGDELILAAHESTLAGEAATEGSLRNRYGYEGEVAQNHKYLTDNGWLVQLDPDNNLYYINPTTQEVLDTKGDYSGNWDEFTGTINFMTHTDARAPIGIGTGAFGTAATGPEGVNVVAGEPTVPLTEWFEMYGNEFTDIVDDRDWEDVLKSSLGTAGYNTYMSTLIGTAIRGAGPDASQMLEGLETTVHYQYLEGRQINEFMDMPIEEFTDWQKRLEALPIGYKALKYGRYDQDFITIMGRAMRQANLDYAADPDGLDRIITDMEADSSYASNLRGPRRSGGTSRVWRPPAYLNPDYAELSQAVKTTFEQKMGRAPSDAEISILSKKMQADHRGEFDAQVAAQKLQFFGSGGDSAGTVQDVSYAARFQEDFESKYADELGTIDKIGMSRQMTQNALGSILAADRAIGY